MVDEPNAFVGVRELLSRIDQRLDVGEKVARMDERVTQKATREEMNAGDFRVLKDVSDMLDRVTSSNNQYVRERVNESSLKTENAMQAMESRLVDKFEAAITRAAAAAVAAMATAQPQTAQQGGDKRIHPALPFTGGLGGGAFILYMVLAFFNVVPRP